MALSSVLDEPRPAARVAAESAASWNARGVRLKGQGKLADAAACYRKAAELAPEMAPIWSNLGNTLLAMDEVDQAIECLRRALALDPADIRFQANLAVALNTRGVGLKAKGKTDEAVACYREALTLTPERGAIWSNLGNALTEINRQVIAAEPGAEPNRPPKDLKQLEYAVECHRRALALEPDTTVFRENLGIALNNWGAALKAKGQFAKAAECHRETVLLAPGRGWSWSNYGNALKDLKLLDTAIECHRRALAIEPDSVPFLFNLAVTLAIAAKPAEAIDVLDQALVGRPGDPHIRWDRGLNYLRLSDFARGWIDYEARFETGKLPKRDLPGTRWAGEPYPGERLFLASEQGFGDGIWTARYLHQAKALGSGLVLEARRELVPLVQAMGVADQVIAKGERPPPCDRHAYICSLPGMFTPEPAAITGAPYLTAPAERRTKFAPVFVKAGDQFKVGIVWSGSTSFKANRDRAVPLRRFLEAFVLPGVQLYSLQKGPPLAELGQIQRAPVIDLAPLLDDFADAAAAVAELDLVIMTDSAVAHLAGALGKPVWVLLNHGAYWLWQDGRTDTPWYDSVRLFRPKVWGDWAGVFDEAAAELLRLIGRQPHGMDG